MPHAVTFCITCINPKYHSKPCYYTYKFSVALFTWGGVLVFVVPMVCGCMGHITAWGGDGTGVMDIESLKIG